MEKQPFSQAPTLGLDEYRTGSYGLIVARNIRSNIDYERPSYA